MRRLQRSFVFRSSRDPVREGLATGGGEGLRAVPFLNETAARRRPFRSPSRFRFRPPDPLTFGFRLLPPVPASTYLRSVLGANGNLGEDLAAGKRSERRKRRNLQEFNCPHFHSRPCSLWKGGHRAARRRSLHSNDAWARVDRLP